VLGPVDVNAGGHRLSLQSSKIRCLAAILALNGGCHSVLARDIGIEPGPALTVLLSRMLTDDDALTASLSPVPRPASAAGRLPGRRVGRSMIRPPSRSGR
jgi:hypothetical protein